MAVVVESLSSSMTVMGKLDDMAWKPPWISFLKKFSGEIMCHWFIRFGLLIARPIQEECLKLPRTTMFLEICLLSIYKISAHADGGHRSPSAHA
jgi:hypothetical protein